MLNVIHGDCEDVLDSLVEWNCIIADPPDNLGLQYDGMVDNLPEAAYYDWLERLILKSMLLAPVVWWSIYHKHDFEIKRRLGAGKLGKLGMNELRSFIWRFTFGPHRVSDCGNGFRPILRISRPGFAWDTDSIKVPSERMALGDSRAAAGGRVPDDVWDFSRVCGNFPERRSWHVTQHPQALYIRMMKLSGAVAKQRPWRVLDLFGGTGTLLRAARELQMKNSQIEATVVEQSAFYCQKMGGANRANPTTVPSVMRAPGCSSTKRASEG